VLSASACLLPCAKIIKAFFIGISCELEIAFLSYDDRKVNCEGPLWRALT
jgi:hypothetical protein